MCLSCLVNLINTSSGFVVDGVLCEKVDFDSWKNYTFIRLIYSINVFDFEIVLKIEDWIDL